MILVFEDKFTRAFCILIKNLTDVILCYIYSSFFRFFFQILNFFILSEFSMHVMYKPMLQNCSCTYVPRKYIPSIYDRLLFEIPTMSPILILNVVGMTRLILRVSKKKNPFAQKKTIFVQIIMTIHTTLSICSLFSSL